MKRHKWNWFASINWLFILIAFAAGIMLQVLSREIQNLKGQLKATITAEVFEENKRLKMELTTMTAFNKGCNHQTERQWDALSLWRSGYLKPECKETRNPWIEFEYGIMSQATSDPDDFEEEFEILDNLKKQDKAIQDKENTIKACLDERHQYMMEVQACLMLLENHNCGHGSGKAATEHIEGELLNMVQEAIKIKDNIPNR